MAQKQLTAIDMNGNAVSNLPTTPASANDAASKAYVDDNAATPISTQTVGDNATLDSFGDSITYGQTSTNPATDSYPAIWASMKGWSLTNHAVSGARINDGSVLDAIMSQIVGDNNNYSIMIGTNGAKIAGTNLGYLDTYRGCLANEVAWLAIPDEHKIYANTCTTTGVWASNTATTVGNSNGYKTDDTSATLSTTVEGTAVYISTYTTATSTAKFKVEIDGVNFGEWDASQHNSVHTRQNDSIAMSAYLLRYSGLGDGSHEVKITAVNSTVYVDWIAGNGFHRSIDGPNVYVGAIIRATDDYYSSNPDYSDKVVALYNGAVSEVVSSLAMDGLNVCFVDTLSALNNTTDMYDSNDLHPNDTGYNKLAQVFYSYSSSFVKPRDRGASMVKNTPWFEPVLLNGWTNYSSTLHPTPAYMKDACGVVHLRGVVNGGTFGSSSVIFKLPRGFRPSVSEFMGTISSTTAPGAVWAKSNGDLIAFAGAANGYASLSGLSFVASQ